ncbi:MAG TPA: hypothetical protein DCS07_02235 [Bdellovibrionales bacterium]|nr:hypothetical protein [Bdellovibrionales bacterium]
MPPKMALIRSNKGQKCSEKFPLPAFGCVGCKLSRVSNLSFASVTANLTFGAHAASLFSKGMLTGAPTI